MFDPDSRYASLPTGTHTTAEGREIVYVRRRFLPRSQDLTIVGTAIVADGERLDQISARTLGEPGQWWWICDANDAMRPRDLVSRAGARLRIAGAS